jgi:hypothetical protein
MAIMKAVEVSGKVNDKGELLLDQPIATTQTGIVRVILLFPEAEEIDETEWQKGAASNPAFAFLDDAEEDIYSLEDGKPLNEG